MLQGLCLNTRSPMLQGLCLNTLSPMLQRLCPNIFSSKALEFNDFSFSSSISVISGYRQLPEYAQHRFVAC